ncbi:SPFH domain-containing protein [Erythrobacter sp. F6033]|uniref:SPFH domain-containing protein n=1 Tax=Erythrobacter sp. F6033 TaxID=2926401 RepID=UPI001FF4D813|nr:SPFH domain-containing protein [Erythrobacter sp. F6033]MCK0127421.1 SPFH domain-containing protein [Erythrobacter sp. F6033]
MFWSFIGLIAAVAVLGLVLRTMLNRHVVHLGHTGLLYSNESFVKTLEPGAYWRFDPLSNDTIVSVSMVPTALTPNQFDVISKDQFAFRLTLAPLVTITDARAFHEGAAPVAVDMAQFYPGPEMRLSRLNPVLAHAVMAAVSAKTLEEFVANPQAALEGLKDQIADVLPGTTVDRIAITSIQLPPEVRKMFTEVERARREGLAGLERAKAEQASLRALANAARNLANNPQLAQLRMLQTMESAKGAKTFVLGNASELAAGEEPAKS